MDQLLDLAGALAKLIPAAIIFLFFLLGSFLKKNRAKGQSPNRMPEFGGAPVFKPAATRPAAPQRAPGEPHARKPRQSEPPMQRVPGSDPSAPASFPVWTDVRMPETTRENQPVYRESVKRSFEGDAGESGSDTRRRSEAAPLSPQTIDRASSFQEPGNSSSSRAGAGAPALCLLDQDEALKGLVWAEILGPPKARKFQRNQNR